MPTKPSVCNQGNKLSAQLNRLRGNASEFPNSKSEVRLHLSLDSAVTSCETITQQLSTPPRLDPSANRGRYVAGCVPRSLLQQMPFSA
mmetsp:Transcript_151141/g.278638  ORF Transcript_151141/g.278638 Transcript_151141/m.278638 type:complete len:88 (+) Transcript_151141:2-265(+)